MPDGVRDPGSTLFGRLRARLWGRGRARKKREQAQRRAAAMRVLYEQFREILAANDAALHTIADVEDRLSGRAPFSLGAQVRQIRRTIMDVFVMVKNLNRIAGGRYGELYDVLRALNERFEEEASGHTEIPQGPVVLPIASLRRDDARAAGTKMANLGELRSVLRLEVPDGFVVTTAAYQRFMTENDLAPGVERLEEILETYGTKVLAEACRKVRTGVLDTAVPTDIEKTVLAAFDDLGAEGEELLVAVRSSALKEDQTASHAGQYYTELNVGRGWLLDAYRSVLASAFGPSAVAYRLGHGLSGGDAAMAVGVLRMLRPRCSGIMFSRGFDDPAADRILISVVPGLADGLAAGSVSGEEITILPGEERRTPSAFLSGAELEELARVARRCETHFGAPQDIEWAIDEQGKLFVLQSRPMRAAPPTPEPSPVETGAEPPGEPLLAGGLVACPGCGAGDVYRIQSEQELDNVPDGAVLAAPHSSPRLSQVMTRCAAIVTEQGSPTGHMAILAREFNVPTIVALRDAVRTLEHGRPVTVDAGARRVYAGRVESILRACGARPPFADTPAVRKLQRIARHITPLHLVEPTSPEFTPAGCRSLHDITRFVHEKLFGAMFDFADKAEHRGVASARLEGNLPYIVHVFDLGGGFADGAGSDGSIAAGDIRSIPLRSFLEGLQDPRIRWDQPRAVSGQGFLSVLGEAMVSPPAEVRGVGRPSFATISDRYMNFSTKAGYHFNTVDTWCGKSLNKNYIHFRFEGGGAQQQRRARRCRFLSIVLEGLDFKVVLRGDALLARLEKYEREFLLERLVHLGRLTLCARQLDMLMDTEESPESFARAFLDGRMERF